MNSAPVMANAGFHTKELLLKTVKNRQYHSTNYLASFPTHVGDLPRQFRMFGKRFPIVAGLPFTSRFTNPMLTLATSPKVDDEIQLYIYIYIYPLYAGNFHYPS